MNASHRITRAVSALLGIGLLAGVLAGCGSSSSHSSTLSGSSDGVGTGSNPTSSSSASARASKDATSSTSPRPTADATSVEPEPSSTPQALLAASVEPLSDHGYAQMTVSNTGDAPLNWWIDYVPSTMTVSPATRGSLDPGATRYLAVTVGAADGDYSYDLKVRWDGGTPVTATVKGRIEIAPTISAITVKDRTVCANSSKTQVDVRAHITDLGDVSTATLHYIYQGASGNSSGESYWDMVADSTYYKDATWFVQHGANFPPGRITIWVVAVDRSGNRRESAHSYVGFVDFC
ncbi:MAG: hypothetical protein QOJ92_625 [Frankiales bacterium]|nr:hypothetical protein [Frankiales bacterium]